MNYIKTSEGRGGRTEGVEVSITFGENRLQRGNARIYAMFYYQDLKQFLRVFFITSPLPAPPHVVGCYREKTTFLPS